MTTRAPSVSSSSEKLRGKGSTKYQAQRKAITHAVSPPRKCPNKVAIRTVGYIMAKGPDVGAIRSSADRNKIMTNAHPAPKAISAAILRRGSDILADTSRRANLCSAASPPCFIATGFGAARRLARFLF